MSKKIIRGDFIFFQETIDERLCNFRKAGILPFLLENDASELSNRINMVLEHILLNDTNNPPEMFCVYPLKFNESTSKWKTKIPREKLELLREFNMHKLDDKDKEAADRELEPNYPLNILLGLFKEKCQLADIFNPSYRNNNFKLSKWRAMIGIEPVTSEAIHKYNRNHYGFFSGNAEKNDNTILDVAIRETREEGKVLFHPTILSGDYQLEIRAKYDILFVPLYLDVPLQKNFSRTYIIFMENIKFTRVQDLAGNLKHIKVSPVTFE